MWGWVVLVFTIIVIIAIIVVVLSSGASNIAAPTNTVTTSNTVATNVVQKPPVSYLQVPDEDDDEETDDLMVIPRQRKEFNPLRDMPYPAVRGDFNLDLSVPRAKAAHDFDICEDLQPRGVPSSPHISHELDSRKVPRQSHNDVDIFDDLNGRAVPSSPNISHELDSRKMPQQSHNDVDIFDDLNGRAVPSSPNISQELHGRKIPKQPRHDVLSDMNGKAFPSSPNVSRELGNKGNVGNNVDIFDDLNGRGVPSSPNVSRELNSKKNPRNNVDIFDDLNGPGISASPNISQELGGKRSVRQPLSNQGSPSGNHLRNIASPNVSPLAGKRAMNNLVRNDDDLIDLGQGVDSEPLLMPEEKQDLREKLSIYQEPSSPTSPLTKVAERRRKKGKERVSEGKISIDSKKTSIERIPATREKLSEQKVSVEKHINAPNVLHWRRHGKTTTIELPLENTEKILALTEYKKRPLVLTTEHLYLLGQPPQLTRYKIDGTLSKIVNHRERIYGLSDGNLCQVVLDGEQALLGTLSTVPSEISDILSTRDHKILFLRYHNETLIGELHNEEFQLQNKTPYQGSIAIGASNYQEVEAPSSDACFLDDNGQLVRGETGLVLTRLQEGIFWFEKFLT